MDNLLASPDFYVGLAMGTVLGGVVIAGLFFHFEAQDLARQQREAEENAKARRAAEAAQRWPGAANDDTRPHTARSEQRRGPR